MSFKISFVTNEICLKLEWAKTVFSCFQEKKSNDYPVARVAYHHNQEAFSALHLGPLDHPDIVKSDNDKVNTLSTITCHS